MSPRVDPAAAVASPQTDDEIVEQAAQWIVRLTDDDEAERQAAQAAYEAWKLADPRHAVAASEMERLIGQIQTVRTATVGGALPARAALDATSPARQTRLRARRVAATLAWAMMLALPTWAVLDQWSPAYLLSDIHTSTGQWESRVLPDGTRITLNTDTAVNLHYDAQHRAVELVQGEILVDVAKDPSRAFVVETRDGSMRALGTHFVVDLRKHDTVLSMIQSRVAVQTAQERAANSPHAVQVEGGQRVHIDASRVGPIETIDARSLADVWAHHQLVVSDQPLAEVLDALSRHRTGSIFYDRARIANIRVSAVLPLDDTDQALRLLLANFPELRIRTLTPWLVLVDGAS